MDILIKPIVSEKRNQQSENLNRYAFVVHQNANKLQIKKAVEDLYNVRVDSVKTMIYGGKTKSRYTKTGMIRGKANSFKKAVVTLVEGDVIDFYSNI